MRKNLKTSFFGPIFHAQKHGYKIFPKSELFRFLRNYVWNQPIPLELNVNPSDETLVGRGSYKGNNFIANNSSLEGKFLKFWNDAWKHFKFAYWNAFSFYDPIYSHLTPYGSRYYWPNFDLIIPGVCPTNSKSRLILLAKDFTSGQFAFGIVQRQKKTKVNSTKRLNKNKHEVFSDDSIE